jgi:serine/threonine protein kinase/tetratricopeptide (TPR) repeat protein
MTMDAGRWQRVRQLVEDALDKPVAERAQFLAASCQSDDLLLREVTSLMAASDAASHFIEQPPAWLADEVTTIPPGTQVERYRIVSLLGRGGMGDVYLAEDQELGRQVALKFLPKDVAGDTGRLRRFEQEARAASALNHPNIITIYEIGRSTPAPFLAVEYIDGQTLREQLDRGPLDIGTAIDEAIQIAEALSAAHRAGITHRDLKPENAMVRRDGLIKVLDFGLAKLGGPEPVKPASPELTSPGTVMGTASYMSPEQARGLEAGAPSDLFSFGALLYEMVTGSRPFPGVNMIDVLASVLAREPRPVKELRADAPDGLQPIINKLLYKDVSGRYASADDVIADLKALRKTLRARPTPRARVFSPLRWGRAASVMAAVLIAGVALYLVFKPSPALSDKDLILLTDFVNQTGDAVFDDTLKEALVVQLEQSPFLSLVPDAKVRATLPEMNRSADDPITRDTGREIGRRLGATVVLTGSIYPIGSRYGVTLDAMASETGKAVAREEQQAGGKDQVLTAVAATVTRMRRRLGESPESIQKFDAPVGEATTASLEALKAFNQGRRHTALGRRADAIALYQRAVALDPNFALAWSELANNYSISAQRPLRLAAAEKAFALRGRVSAREQFHITSDYYTDVTRELDKAIQVYVLWQEAYPRDTLPAVKLGNRYLSLGMYDAAVQQLQATRRLAPETPVVWQNLGRALVRLNRFDDADAVLREAQERHLDTENMRETRFDLAFVRGDMASMQRAIADARGKPDDEYNRAYEQGAIAAFGGRFRRAQGFYRRAAELAETHKLPPQQVGWATAAAAISHAYLGQCPDARAAATQALAGSRHMGVVKSAILALAQCGDIQRAQALYSDLSQSVVQDDLILRLPAFQAAILLAAHQPAGVLDMLKSSPYEPDDPSIAFAPSWLRGQAFLDTKNGSAAAAEFQRIVDHRGWAPKSIIWPLAHLGLARAHAMIGARDHSRTRYEQFFALWKEADPDVPILIDARREYQALSAARGQ